MSESKPRWEVVLTRQAEKTLYRLSKNQLRHIDQTLLALVETPRPAESQQLAGYDHLYRLPVAEWRITYTVEDERFTILILEIALKQQPERYRLEEEDFSPDPPSQPNQMDVPPVTELRPPLLARPGGRFEPGQGDFFHSGSSLLKRIRKEKIRLLIGDHFLESREDLRKLLFGESDIEIVGMAANGEEAIQMAAAQQPDIVLLDTNLSGIDGLTACERISQQLPSAQIIMMSVQGEADYFRRVMLVGAKEFLIKPFSGLELATSIRRVYRAAALQRLHDPRPDAFSDLKERIRVTLMAELDPGMDVLPPEQVRQLVQDRFDQILAQENIILSRPERKRLFESLTVEIQGELSKSEQPTAQPGNETVVDLDEGQTETTALWFKFYKLGNRVEISLSVTNLVESLAFYDQLGFASVDGGERPYPWAVVSDGLIRLGLHQTPKLTQPTLTYFAPDMPERLERLREKSFRFMAEHKDKQGRRTDAVIESPDGQRFFLFTSEAKAQSSEQNTSKGEAEVDKFLKHPQVENSQANGSFKIGQKVRIIEGPFEDFMGTVNKVDPDQARVKVQISFFGQEKLVEFDFSQVERA